MTATVWTWLRDTGHVYPALVGAACGSLMTVGVVGLVLRPLAHRVRVAWRAHEAVQATIAERLDASTPSGLGEVVAAIKSSDAQEKAD